MKPAQLIALRVFYCLTMEQFKRVTELMPTEAEIDQRNLTLAAFTLLGARDSAIASMKSKHAGCVYQDARDVRTKFRKTLTTYFPPLI